MITVPAFVWRYGVLGRTALTGAGAALPLAGLAWIDSGIWLAAVFVLILLTPGFGIWLTRTMAKHWPGGKELSGPDRVTVVRTARRGEHIENVRLAQPLIDYRFGLHAAAEKARPFRWLIGVVLTIAAGMAVWDFAMGSTRDGISSCVYLGLILIEVLWWPSRERQLLTNADRAAAAAQDVLTNSVGGSN